MIHVVDDFWYNYVIKIQAINLLNDTWESFACKVLTNDNYEYVHVVCERHSRGTAGATRNAVNLVNYTYIYIVLHFLQQKLPVTAVPMAPALYLTRTLFVATFYVLLLEWARPSWKYWQTGWSWLKKHIHVRIEKKQGGERVVWELELHLLWHFSVKDPYPVRKQVVGNVTISSNNV